MALSLLFFDFIAYTVPNNAAIDQSSMIQIEDAAATVESRTWRKIAI
ncbi:hypothetical protein LG201_01075 [Methylobacillus gramineus]|nr:hypothetical protein [Methylobacillus gramineus]MCB5183797.1 hypothetical protein [Methylobacillus gramineus]